MANTPLDKTYVFQGRIYLRGETLHPDKLVSAIEKRDKIFADRPINANDDPIFRGSARMHSHETTHRTRVPANLQLHGAPPVAETTGSTPLPGDFPYRDRLLAAGLINLEVVGEVPDLTDFEFDDDEAQEIRNALATSAEVPPIPPASAE